MDATRFHRLIQRLDELNSQDPHTLVLEGVAHPTELLYARQVTRWVERLDPNASEALRIAARGQHVCRWMIPRDRYAHNRQGYLQWRETLKAFHMQKVAELMREAAYTDTEIEHVQRLMSKRHLMADPEAQTLEDALCLAFLETQFSEFRHKTPDDKMREILRKTWQKMSARARAAAGNLALGEEERRFLEHTLSTPSSDCNEPQTPLQ